MGESILRGKIKELKELTRMREELEQEIKAIQDELKAEMERRGAEKIIVGEYKVLYTTVRSTKFDSKAFREQFNDLYHAYTRQTLTKRFSVA